MLCRLPRYSHHCYVRADDRHASAIGPISYLLDLTSSQAVVMGWAPLVSASFLFIWGRSYHPSRGRVLETVGRCY